MMDCTRPRHSKILKAWKQQECWACETAKCWYSPVECALVQSLEKKQKLALHKWKVKYTRWSAMLIGSLKWLPWTIHCMEFSRPEYWNGWPFSSPQDLPDTGIEPRSPAWKVDSLPAELPVKPETFYGFLQILHPGVGRVRTERTHLPT